MKLKTTFLVFLLVCCLSIPVANGESAKTKTPKVAAVSAEIKAAAHAAAGTGCDASLWQHVYHPGRLLVVEKCIAVTGTIHHIKREADGDDHIQVKMDAPFDKLLNGRNNQVRRAP
jgi:hypothetical protein